MYVSKDRHTTFATIYPAGIPGFNGTNHIKETRAALQKAAPPGVTANLTGRDPLEQASSGGKGPSVVTEALIAGVGALVILFFVFGTLPAVAIPLAIAVASILNTFTLVWILTYGTSSGDNGTGRLLKSMRLPAGTALWSGGALQGTEAPSISGSLVPGKRISVSHGKWSGSPLAYGYQWERCATSQESCAPILGATNANYTVQSTDLGHALAVIVTATNAGGSATQAAYSTRKAESEKELLGSYELAEYPVGHQPFGITTGPDGNLWFTDRETGKVGKITPMLASPSPELAPPVRQAPVRRCSKVRRRSRDVSSMLSAAPSPSRGG